MTDIHKAVKRLRPNKSVALDISGFIIKRCSNILVPVFQCIFNLSISQQHLPMQWKQSVVVPVYKKDNKACNTK